MLEFFRRYQKYFFIAITVVILASFSLFGTYSTFSKDEKREDPIVAHAVDGSPLMLSEVRSLSRFLATDREDRPGHGLLPNLCNDGCIRHDLLTAGVADLLVASYFEAMKPGLDARLDRAKRYRHYAHPHTPILSLDAVWNRFLPEMGQELRSLKEEKEASLSTFSHLARLYQQQQYLSADTLRKILYFQHQQMGLQIDPALAQSDLSLLGYHSLSDWFGNDFLTLAAEFILNGAALAKGKGFEVSLEEAKGDLLVNFQTSLQRIHPPGKPQPAISFSEHLRSLGFDEKRAAEVWQKVLLFRKYFQGVSSQTAFMDRLSYKNYASYANETASVRLYQWPEALRLKNMEDLIQFQFYIAAVALPLPDPLGLPNEFKARELVEEDYPELVQSTYMAKVKDATLPQVALRAPLKEVWEWELDEKNWDALKGIFPFLPVGCSRDERFQSLEKLSKEQRSQVDSYARLRILDRHPEWIEEALESVAFQERTISISKASSSVKIEKPWRLYGLLQRAVSGDGTALEALLNYSDDGKTLYRFEGVEELEAPHVLTFAEARSQGMLSKMADGSLSAAYPKMRAKFPSKFESENGSWKPFSAAKSEIAELYFADVFQAIEGLKKGDWTADLLAQMRLFPATQSAYHDVLADAEQSRAVSKNANRTMDDQFKLEESELSIQRTRQEEWMKEKAFVMMPNEWSPIRVPPNGELSFFYLIDKKPCETPILEQITFGRQSIAADAQRYMAEKLLESILQNHSIIFPKESVQ